MSLLDDIKAKIDANSDGKLSVDDLSAFKEQIGDEQLEKLKNAADRNDDGKLSLDDLNNINLGEALGDAKNSISDFFGKK